MMKRDFLDTIRKGLSSLSQEDINKSIRYYSEMIDDRIEDGIPEEDAVAAMGEPQAVIAEILKDSEPAKKEETAKEEIKKYDVPAEKTEERGKKRRILPIVIVAVAVILLLTAVAMFLPVIKSGFNKDALLNSYGYFSVGSDANATADFESVVIGEGISDVIILPSETGDCLVKFTNIEGIYRYYDISDDGTLYVNCTDNRNWFEKLGTFWYDESTVTIYLPRSEYYKLRISASGNDVFVSDVFEFQSVDITTSSGDIDFRADVGDMNARLKSASGDITVSDITKGGYTIESASGDVTLKNVYLCEKLIFNETEEDIANMLDGLNERFAQSAGITVKTASGDVSIDSVRTVGIAVETASGDIELDDVYNYIGLRAESASGEIEADNTVSLGSVSFKTASGDISFEDLDSYAGITLQSTSGDIEGRIASACFFSVQTASGTVNVPRNNSGSDANGRPLCPCSVTTVSGDIDIDTPQ